MTHTDPRAGDGSSDTAGASPAAEPRPWLVLGVALLVVFLAILGWALLSALT